MAGCEDYCDDDMEDPQAGRDQSTRQAGRRRLQNLWVEIAAKRRKRV